MPIWTNFCIFVTNFIISVMENVVWTNWRLCPQTRNGLTAVLLGGFSFSTISRRHDLFWQNIIQQFSWHRFGADAVFCLLLSFGKDTGQAHFRKLFEVAATHGRSPVDIVDQLCRTFVFRPSVLVARGGCHDKPLHLLHYLLVLQLRVSDATQSSLFHGQTVSLVHRGLDGLRSHFHSCSAISAQGRPPTGGNTTHGPMACSLRHLPVV